MFRFVRAFSASSSSHSTRRGFSDAASPKESGFQRFGSFISKNKQALINTMGVYFVLSYSVHNYRVQQAWDQREVEFKALEEEVTRMQETLGSTEWINKTEETIKKNYRNKTSVLGAEISKVLSVRSDIQKVQDKQSMNKSSNSEIADLNELASLVDGGNSSKSAGDKKKGGMKIV